MEIVFSKVQSLLCDHVLIDSRGQQGSLPAAPELLARYLTRRHTAIGGEGLLLLGEAVCTAADDKIEVIKQGRCWIDDDEHVVSLRYFACDGVETAPSEEALRGAATYLILKNNRREGRLRVGVPGGERKLDVHRLPSGGGIEVVSFLPPPAFDARAAGLRGDRPLLGRPLSVRGFSYPIYAVAVGGMPFAVCFEFGTSLERLHTAEVGIPLTMHPLFTVAPTAVFAAHTAPNVLSVRIWESRAGELPASTTAAAAAFSVSCLLGRYPVGQKTSVCMRGGAVLITAASVGGALSVTAPAVYCFDGRARLDMLTGLPC